MELDDLESQASIEFLERVDYTNIIEMLHRQSKELYKRIIALSIKNQCDIIKDIMANVENKLLIFEQLERNELAEQLNFTIAESRRRR